MTSKKKVLIFYINVAIFQLAANFAHPVTPTMFQTLGFGDYMFGVALAFMMIVNFALSPFWGKINTYIGSRTSLLISGIGYGIGQILFGFSTTEGAVLLARMFSGAFIGGGMVSMLTYVVNTTEDPRQRGQYLTVLATVQSVCGAFGYFIGGMLGEISVKTAFVVQGITLAVAGVLFFVTCHRDTEHTLAEVQPKVLLREANPLSAFIASKEFMTAILAVLFVVCALQNLGFTAFDHSFNYYIKDQFGFPPSYNGSIKAVMGLITLLANSTICIYLINKTNVKRSIIGVLGLTTLAFVGVVSIESVIPFVIIAVVYYSFNSVSVPLLQNLVAERGQGSQSNLVMGFYNSMKSLGGIFGALVSGMLYTVNPKFPFVLGTAAVAIATVCAVIYYQDSRKKELAENTQG